MPTSWSWYSSRTHRDHKRSKGRPPGPMGPIAWATRLENGSCPATAGPGRPPRGGKRVFDHTSPFPMRRTPGQLLGPVVGTTSRYPPTIGRYAANRSLPLCDDRDGQVWGARPDVPEPVSDYRGSVRRRPNRTPSRHCPFRKRPSLLTPSCRNPTRSKALCSATLSASVEASRRCTGRLENRYSTS